MSEKAPLTRTLTENAPNVAANADNITIVGESPFAATVAGVSYTPDAAITGADTESRSVSLVNRGDDGTGDTVVASLDFADGTDAAAADEVALTLSATAADLVVAAGDILAWVSTHVGTTGLADPGGLVQVELSRS